MRKICFFIGTCNDRSGEWNGEIIRYGGVGISGTDTSFVLLAEYLASVNNKYSVSFTASSCKDQTMYKNVHYFKEPKLDADILVIPPSDEFLKYEWSNLKTIVIWCQMQHTFSQNSFDLITKKYPNVNINVNYMNSFTKSAALIYSQHTNYYISDEFFVPNPLLNDIDLAAEQKIPHSFIFNTSYRRGGEIMLNIFNKLPYSDKTLKICSSYKDELKFLYSHSNISILHSLDKNTLYKHLAKTEYFIYPLVAPLEQGANIHKDTFCCAISEALLNEVIVLTFPVGALYELYEDTLVYLPFPDISKRDIHTSGYHSSAPELYSDEFYLIVAKTVEFLENNPHYKDILRKRGKELVIRKFSIDIIGEKWLTIV